ncbi:hypothetical protein PENTCL1PPCAC_8315, partial [Pristionchus entomophagus]
QSKLTYNDHVDVLVGVKSVLELESAQVKCGVETAFFGDLHGQFPDLVKWLIMFSTEEYPAWINYRLVFMGYYVDRGKHSLKVIHTLFLLKILYPKNIFLLRGKHETKGINGAK